MIGRYRHVTMGWVLVLFAAGLVSAQNRPDLQLLPPVEPEGPAAAVAPADWQAPAGSLAPRKWVVPADARAPGFAASSVVPAGSEAPASAEAPAGPKPLPAPDDVLAALGEQVPEVVEEPVVEYQWFDPHYWFRPPYWEGSIEAGINGSEGNTNSFSIKSGMSLKRTTEFHTMGFNINYARTSANSVETQHYALFNGQYERLFRNDSPWSLFAKTILQYDEFRPFDLRLTVNGGVGYRFIKTDHLLLKGRLGAGASREFGGISDEWVPEAVFGADYEHQLTKKQKLVLNVDYFPAWGDFNDYRLLTVFAWEVVLDEEANLHFKLAINDQYDSTPDGSVPNDLNYSMMLLWKL